MAKTNKSAVPATLLGSRISTPRGDFLVSYNSADEAKALGYGLHFEYDGFAILVKDNQAVAAPLVPFVPAADQKKSTATSPIKAPKTSKAKQPAKSPGTPAKAPAAPAKAEKKPDPRKAGKVETSLTPAAKAKAQTQLESITASIRKETGNIAGAYMRIGYDLWQVKERKLYLAVEVDGKPLKNVYEYAEMAFGFKRSSAKNFIAVCEQFSTKSESGQPTADIAPAFRAFGYTQLSEMLALPEEKRSLATADMSKRDIHALKSGQPVGQSDDGENPDADPDALPAAKSKRTVIFDGQCNDKNWDKIMDKLDALMDAGKHIQIIVCD